MSNTFAAMKTTSSCSWKICFVFCVRFLSGVAAIRIAADSPSQNTDSGDTSSVGLELANLPEPEEQEEDPQLVWEQAFAFLCSLGSKSQFDSMFAFVKRDCLPLLLRFVNKSSVQNELSLLSSHCSEEKFLTTAKWLLEYCGADPNALAPDWCDHDEKWGFQRETSRALESKGYSPAHCALSPLQLNFYKGCLREHSLELVKLLIDHGADVNPKSQPPLAMLAAYHDEKTECSPSVRAEMARLLVKSKADIDHKADIDPNIPALTRLAHAGLIQIGTNSPLEIAAARCDPHLVQEFLQLGAEPSISLCDLIELLKFLHGHEVLDVNQANIVEMLRLVQQLKIFFPNAKTFSRLQYFFPEIFSNNVAKCSPAVPVVHAADEADAGS